MSHLNPNKLHVDFLGVNLCGDLNSPRMYTLTHSDSTGDLFLSIGKEINRKQVSGWYTRFMRDEVLAEWHFDEVPSLHVHCHISGGIVLGSASWRKDIFHQHMPMVLEAFCFGDREFIAAHPELCGAVVWLHFHARQARYNQVESWGRIEDIKKI